MYWYMCAYLLVLRETESVFQIAPVRVVLVHVLVQAAIAQHERVWRVYLSAHTHLLFWRYCLPQCGHGRTTAPSPHSSSSESEALRRRPRLALRATTARNCASMAAFLSSSASSRLRTTRGDETCGVVGRGEAREGEREREARVGLREVEGGSSEAMRRILGLEAEALWGGTGEAGNTPSSASSCVRSDEVDCESEGMRAAGVRVSRAGAVGAMVCMAKV